MTYYHKSEIDFVSDMFISNAGNCFQKKKYTGLHVDIIR